VAWFIGFTHRQDTITPCVSRAARRWFELGEEAAVLRCCAVGLFGRVLDA